MPAGPVDIAHVRRPIDGSSTQSIIAMITGIDSGLQPAITALAAILRTVPMPKPGANRPTTSLPSQPDAAIIASTLACVGGTSGSPSLQPLPTNDVCIASNASIRSAPRKMSSGALSSTMRENCGSSSKRVRSVVRYSTTVAMASSTMSAIWSGVLLEKHSGTITGHASGTPKVLRLKRASSSKIAAV